MSATDDLSTSQRAMSAAKLARRGMGQRDQPGVDLPPSIDEAAVRFRISPSAIARAKDVLRNGTTSLREAVEVGLVPVYTAARVATQMPPEDQDQFVRRVENGARPETLAPPAPSPGASHADAAARTTTKARHRIVGVEAVEQMRYGLQAIGLVLNTASDGLDPSINSEQAGHLLTGLSKDAAHLRRLVALLKNRKESRT